MGEGRHPPNTRKLVSSPSSSISLRSIRRGTMTKSKSARSVPVASSPAFIAISELRTVAVDFAGSTLNASSTNLSTSPNTTITTPPSSISSAVSALATNSTIASHGGLSVAEKAGIGAGASLGFILFLGLLATFFFLGRKFALQKRTSPLETTNSTFNQKSELGTNGPRGVAYTGTQEMEGGMTKREVTEMCAGQRHELEAKRGVFEID